MSTRRQFCSALALGLSTAAHSRAGAAYDDLRARLDALREQAGIAAMGLAVVRANATLFSDAWGVVDRARARAVTPRDRFRVGSITKTLTGLAALRLADAGILALDARIADHLGDLPLDNPWQRSAPIRLVNLLEHTAGLTDLTRAEFDHSDPAPFPLEQAVRQYASKRIVHWRPDEHSEYSNAGYGLAGLMLQRAAHTPYEELVRELVLEPLGMRDSTLMLDPVTRARLVTGYDHDGRTPIPYWHMIYRPFGALNATVADMTRLVRCLLGRGRLDDRTVFSAAQVARLERPTTTLAARAGLDYGYGLGNYTWQRQGHTFHGHGGDGDGYLAHYGYCVDLDRGYFVVINAYQRDSLRQMRALIEEALIPQPRVPPSPARLTADELERHTGRYRAGTWRFNQSRRPNLIITRRDTNLMTQASSGESRALIPAGGDVYRRTGQTVATAAFCRDSDGRAWLQDDLGNFQRTD